MASRINLDFYVRGPERRQCVRERMALQRAPMYEWRHDFAESAFDAATGERRLLQRVFNPVPKEHPVSTRDTRAAASNVDARTACKGVGQGSDEPQQQQWSRHQCGPQHTLRYGDTAGIEVSSARPATATGWESAVQGISDRRRTWKRTGFTFTEDHFRKSAHAPVSLAHLGVATAASEAYRRAGKSEVFVPYLHDTILFGTPLLHPKEPRASWQGSGSGGGAAAASANPLPPVHRASSAAGVALAVTSNAAESRARELQASMDAKRRGSLSISAAARSHRSQPQPSASHQHAVGVQSFTNDGDNETSTMVGPTSGSNYLGAAAAVEQVNTCCDVLGPSIAARQRAVALAEGVYTDLILNRTRAHSAAPTAGVTKTEVPTCELAYSLRPSYVQSCLSRSAARRSCSSSQNVATVGIASDCYSASLDAGASGTTQHTTAATSPMTGYASAPRIFGHRGNGVSGPPYERAVTRSPANESLAGTAPAPAMAMAATDANTFVLRSGSAAHQSNATTASPLALSPIKLGRNEDETEKARSPDSIDDQATSKTSSTSATADARAGRDQGRRSTASPLLNGGTAQLQPEVHPSPKLFYPTSNSVDSQTLVYPYGDGGGSTVAGGSACGGDELHHCCPQVRHSQENRHRSSVGQSGQEHMCHNAQQQHQHCQRPLTMHRLPMESKETRVYAVRVRRLFTKEGATPLKCAEPPRRGIPVLLPQEWRPGC